MIREVEKWVRYLLVALVLHIPLLIVIYLCHQVATLVE